LQHFLFKIHLFYFIFSDFPLSFIKDFPIHISFLLKVISGKLFSIIHLLV
jgi:hypothetical protein